MDGGRVEMKAGRRAARRPATAGPLEAGPTVNQGRRSNANGRRAAIPARPRPAAGSRIRARNVIRNARNVTRNARNVTRNVGA